MDGLKYFRNSFYTRDKYISSQLLFLHLNGPENSEKRSYDPGPGVAD